MHADCVANIDFQKLLLKNANLLNISLNELMPIAVSGGSDSLALIVAMKRIGYNVIALLVNHKMRDTSDSEFAKTIDIIANLDIPYLIRIWNHDKISSNIEHKARIARYSLLTEMCKEINCNRLCLGHHMDDQVETFFINLLRGSGLNGLCAMPSRTWKGDIEILRPLLNFHKKDMMQYLEELKISWVLDISNNDLNIKRNHLRMLLTNLESAELLTKRINSTISRLQEVRLMTDYFHAQNFNTLIKRCNDELTIDIQSYIGLLSEERLTLLSNALIKCGNCKMRGRMTSLKRLDTEICTLKLKKCTLMHCVIFFRNNSIVIHME